MLKISIRDANSLLKEIETKKFVCYGAGNYLQEVLFKYCQLQLEDKIDLLVDSNQSLWGKKVCCNGVEQEIVSPTFLYNYAKCNDVVLMITSYNFFMEIIETLDVVDELNGVCAYIAAFLHVQITEYPEFFIKKNGCKKIPKIIHYCWFGKNEISKEYKMYMESWKRYCPDYEIRRWDESNFDIKQNKYMKQAYDNEKWAFVSDYARLKILYENGGIYLDCDVELCKSLDDLLISEFYCGFEDISHINLGLGFGSVKYHPYLEELITLYDGLDFVNKDGTLNLTPCPIYQTEVIKKYGIEGKNSYQQCAGISVYPTEVLAPYSFWGMGDITKNTYSIHHYGATWHSKEEKEYIEEWKKRGQRLYLRYKCQLYNK